jgi:hypothetical protein
MKDSRLWVALFAGISLVMVQALVNQILSPVGVWVRFDGLFLLFAGLYLKALPAGIAVALPALLSEAGSADTFGVLMQSYLLALAMLLYFRNRLRRERAIDLLWVAAILTFSLHLGLLLRHGASYLSEPFLWWRFGSDTSLSVLVCALAAVPWVHWQIQLCRSFGSDPASELPKP